MELFELTETCGECGGETGFGPCACGVDGPERLRDGRAAPDTRPRVAVLTGGLGAMREMVRRKLERRRR